MSSVVRWDAGFDQHGILYGVTTDEHASIEIMPPGGELRRWWVGVSRVRDGRALNSLMLPGDKTLDEVKAFAEKFVDITLLTAE